MSVPGAPSRAVMTFMGQGDGAELDVGADANRLGAADQDGDVHSAAGGEQLPLVPVGFGVVDEPDGLAWQAAGG